MPWYAYAFVAAVTWGIHYNLLNKSLTAITPFTAYWLPTVIMMLALPFFHKTLYQDYQNVMAAGTDVKVSTAILAFTSLIASMSLYKAIQMHNPVHVGLIEITYPFFIAIFAFLLFREVHFNWTTVFGGMLALSGSAIIIFNNN